MRVWRGKIASQRRDTSVETRERLDRACSYARQAAILRDSFGAEVPARELVHPRVSVWRTTRNVSWPNPWRLAGSHFVPLLPEDLASFDERIAISTAGDSSSRAIPVAEAPREICRTKVNSKYRPWKLKPVRVRWTYLRRCIIGLA